MSLICSWLFRKEHKGHTIIAHNFRGYDGHFILNYLLQQNRPPQVIYRGTKILDLRYPALEMKARDTLNFCQLKLADFPKAVGLNDLISKGEFPHLLNKPDNWDKVVNFPDPALYILESRTAKDRARFMEWHREEMQRCSGRFDFRSQVSIVCIVVIEFFL